MGWNREQRLCILPDAVYVKILKVLACKDDSALLLAHTLHKIPYIFHCCQIRKEQIKLINAGCCVPVGQQLIGHIGKNVEQHGILYISARLQKSLHAKSQEAAVCDVGMPVKEFGLRPFAHGVESKTDFLQ